jgi:hypothetical protein
MVAIAMAGISVLIAAQILTLTARAKSRNDFLIVVSELRQTFQQAVIRTADWTITKAQNPAMACFAGGSASTCSGQAAAAGYPQPFKLYSADGAVIYDATNPASGYTLNGAACTTFGTTAPASCLIKPLLTWNLQCNLAIDPSCLSPLVVIDLDYQYNGASLGPINFATYGFHLLIPTFAYRQTPTCSGAIPICTGSQQVVCVARTWTCKEFGI